MTTARAFNRGDVVHIAKNLGSWMSHFPNDLEAIVLYSYASEYGGSGRDHNKYAVMFTDDGSETAWYYGEQFTFIRAGGESAIHQLTAETEARKVHERDLLWIAKHWLTIRTNPPSATMNELMRRVGITRPWGSQGEGMAYFANWRQTFMALDPILSAMPDNPEMAILGIQLAPIDVRIGD